MRFRATAAALLIAALTAGASPDARAETFCVEDTEALVWALYRMGVTPEPDVIRLRTGTYRTSHVSGFGGTIKGSLEISGGWAPGCLFRQRGARSTIDGEYERPGLVLAGQGGSSPETIRIAHMTFRRNIDNNRAGLTIWGGSAGAVTAIVEDSRFIDNHVTDHLDEYGAGLFVEARRILVFGNVFTGNHATGDGGAAYLSCTDANAAFTSNTVTMNTAGVGQPGRTGGVMIRGCSWEVANNILWDNEGHDLNAVSTPSVARHNNIGSAIGPIWGDGSNLSVDPQFTSASILRLRRSSPLIDTGLNETNQGLPQFSHDGGPRLVGPAIDMGAYELEILFTDDFDPLVLIPNP